MAMSLNRAQIIGNLTRDPEVRTTPQGAQVASFGVATNMTWTDQGGQKQEKVEFHNVVAWRKLAEICGQYLKKGSKVFIEGRLQTREWTGEDGIKRYRTEIVADNMIMLGGRPDQMGGRQTGEREMADSSMMQRTSASGMRSLPDEGSPMASRSHSDLSAEQAGVSAKKSADEDMEFSPEEEVKVDDLPF